MWIWLICITVLIIIIFYLYNKPCIASPLLVPPLVEAEKIELLTPKILDKLTKIIQVPFHPAQGLYSKIESDPIVVETKDTLVELSDIA